MDRANLCKRKMGKNLIFICIENRFRSVAAEYLFRKMLLDNDADPAGKINVQSAGFLNKTFWSFTKRHKISLSHPIYRKRAPDRVREILLNDYGLNVSSHISRHLKRDMVKNTDMIITFSLLQKADLGELFPELRLKIFQAGESFEDGDEVYQSWNDVTMYPHDDNLFRHVYENPKVVRRMVADIHDCLIRMYQDILNYLKDV